MQDYSGHQIDRYEIVNRLGIGGMAVVYNTCDVRLERDVTPEFIHTEVIPAEQRESVPSVISPPMTATATITLTEKAKSTSTPTFTSPVIYMPPTNTSAPAQNNPPVQQPTSVPQPTIAPTTVPEPTDDPGLSPATPTPP